MFEFLLSGVRTILLNPGYSLFLVIMWGLVAWWMIWVSKQEGDVGDGKGFGMVVMGIITMLITFAILNVIETPDEYQQKQARVVRKIVQPQRPQRSMYNSALTRI